jgi:hypothetical protein
MLGKVVADFMSQLDEDIAAQMEREKKVREAQRMMEEERRGQRQVRKHGDVEGFVASAEVEAAAVLYSCC